MEKTSIESIHFDKLKGLCGVEMSDGTLWEV